MNRITKSLKRRFEHPYTQGMDIDAPETTYLRKKIIFDKVYLRYIYEDWYRIIGNCFSESDTPILEIGSGAGFSDKFIANVITTDIFETPGIQAVADGLFLPFRSESLAGIFTLNVLHHLPSPETFFTEAYRTVKQGGRLVMIEPWATRFSSLIYRYLHHEIFDQHAASWEISGTGPLSGANGALPWIIFERDRTFFESKFIGWQIQQIRPMMPIRYLLSGGVSMRFSPPAKLYRVVAKFEKFLDPWSDSFAMFAKIVLKKSRD